MPWCSPIKFPGKGLWNWWNHRKLQLRCNCIKLGTRYSKIILNEVHKWLRKGLLKTLLIICFSFIIHTPYLCRFHTGRLELLQCSSKVWRSPWQEFHIWLPLQVSWNFTSLVKVHQIISISFKIYFEANLSSNRTLNTSYFIGRINNKI